MAASTAIVFFLIVAAATSSPPTAACAPPPLLSSDVVDPAFPRLLNRTAHLAVLFTNRTGVCGTARCRSGLNRDELSRRFRLTKRAVEGSLLGARQRFALNRSCSGEPVRWIGFKPVLNEVLVRLRAGLLNGVDDGRFSYSENTSIDGNTIYGIVGCIQTLTTPKCKTCVDAATNELSQECGGQTQGYITNRSCFAMFKFSPSLLPWPVLGQGGREGKKDTSRRVKMVLIVWTILAVCVAGLVLSAWFVQRSIMNRARVGVLDGAVHDGKL